VIAFLFPGQGAQGAGFLHALGGPLPHPVIAETFTEASDVLARDVSRLDDAGALRSTVAVQIALLVAGVAATRALCAEGIGPDAVAGLSVGAYGAAVACGSIAFDDALRLVQLRAQLMEQAYPSGYGMLAVVGLNEREIGRAISESGAKAYIGNLNAPRQIVVSGSDSALERVRQRVIASGARKAERLTVNVPSHCELLDDAAQQLIAAAAKIGFAAPRIPYIGNRRARVLRTAEAVRDDLATNLRYPVRWHDATVVLRELGVRVMVEMPPGHTLSQLAAEALCEGSPIAAIAVEQSSIGDAAARIRAECTRNAD
jgi:malonate decarboxylase epsilon subunit